MTRDTTPKDSADRNEVPGPTQGPALKITFPTDDKLRARHVVSRSRTRPTGKYPSWKMDRMIQWESQNELNAFRLLDAYPAVVAFQEQPLVIEYQLNDETHRHFPDVLVTWKHGKELWEIKSGEQALRPEVLQRTELLIAALPHYGYDYRIVIAEDLARQPRLDNVCQLLKHGRAAVPDLARERIRQVFKLVDTIAWQTATSGDLGPKGLNALCRLTLEGLVQFKVDEPLGPKTLFRWSGPEGSLK